MTDRPDAHRSFAAVALDPESKARRLRRFLGPAQHEDDEQGTAWSKRSDAEHAQAGAALSDMAARIAQQTGRGKDPSEVSTSLSGLRRERTCTPRGHEQQ